MTTTTTTQPHPPTPPAKKAAHELTPEARAARIEELRIELAALEAEVTKGAFVEYPKVVDGVTYQTAADEAKAKEPPDAPAADPPKKK